jgi:hypothetical protein
MGEVVRIDKRKLQQLREFRGMIQDARCRLDELMAQHMELIRNSPELSRAQLLMNAVFIVSGKSVCGDCLTDDELLQVLSDPRHEDADGPRETTNPKILRCSRCGEEWV